MLTRMSVFATLTVCTGLSFAQTAPPQAPQAPQAPRRATMALNQTVSYLGVNIQEIDSERAKVLRLKEEAGVEVTRVEPESPAEKAGIKTGDAIVQYNGQRVEGIEQFSRMVRETPAGREVKLAVIRAGQGQTIAAKIGSRQTNVLSENLRNVIPRDFNIPMPDVPRTRMSWRSSTLGIEAEALEGQMADFFGVKEGVLVRSVNKGSAAEKAGIKAGDVIVRIGNSKVGRPADVTSQLKAAHDKQVSVAIMREHKEVTMAVTLEDGAPTSAEKF